MSTSHPQLDPATSAESCSSRCGGDQNVSRPMVRCHEMSQISPTTIPSDAHSTAYIGHVACDRDALAPSSAISLVRIASVEVMALPWTW